MSYGVIAAETIQSGTAGQPPQFKDSNGVERGQLCRAWVNFNGTGTVAIRAAFNVSSITDNGVGQYRVNFTNAMPDANYAISGLPDGNNTNAVMMYTHSPTAYSTTSVSVNIAAGSTTAAFDPIVTSVAVFR